MCTLILEKMEIDHKMLEHREMSIIEYSVKKMIHTPYLYALIGIDFYRSSIFRVFTSYPVHLTRK